MLGTRGPRELNRAVVRRLDEAGTYPRWVLLTALAGMFATTFPITVLSVAIPDMAAELEVAETTLAWVITLPVLLSALALPVLGKLGDLYGHRKTFLIGFALATVTTALTATAASAVMLIFWRTLTQVLGAATQPSSLALINSEYPTEQRPKAMGWWAMIAAGAPVIGLVAGGPLIEVFGWRVLFVLQAVLMVVPVASAAAVLRETQRRSARFDVRGSLALAVAAGSVMFVLSQSAAWGLDHPAVLVAAAAAPIGVVGFVKAERRASSPLLPLELLAQRDFASAISVSFFTSASYMGGYFIATLMMRQEFGYAAGAASAILVIRPLVFSASSPLGGHVASRLGNRTTAIAGDTVLALGLGVLALGAASHSVRVVVAGFVLQGLGHGLVRPPTSTAVANSVDDQDLGIAAAAERLLGQIGTASGITLLTAIYGGHADASRLAASFAVGAVIAAAGAAAASAMRPAARGSLPECRT